MLSNCSAEIKRLIYLDNVARWKQTVFSVRWYLTAVNENSNLMSDGKFWKLFKLSIGSIVDIRESDSVIIEWREYTVKWVAQRKWWSLLLTTVILELWA